MMFDRDTATGECAVASGWLQDLAPGQSDRTSSQTRAVDPRACARIARARAG